MSWPLQSHWISILDTLTAAAVDRIDDRCQIQVAIACQSHNGEMLFFPCFFVCIKFVLCVLMSLLYVLSEADLCLQSC